MQKPWEQRYSPGEILTGELNRAELPHTDAKKICEINDSFGLQHEVKKLIDRVLCDKCGFSFD